MKKVFVMILAGTMLLSMAACGQNAKAEIKPTNAAVSDKVVTGGWSNADSPVVTDEMKALLDKALEGMTGVNYVPVAYLGNQVVAGRNHAILCRVAPVVPDAAETYAVVYLYEGLDGKAEISDVKDFGVKTNLSDEDILGGWEQPETPVVSDEAKAVFDKATDGFVVVNYTPVALLSTQIVAGENYCFICEAKVVVPDAESSYVLVYIYEDLSGNAEITDSIDLNSATESGNENVQIPNPFENYETLDEAAKAAGFNMTAPDAVDGYTEKSIQVMSGEMIQVLFYDGNSMLHICKAAGNEDISGDYNVYAENRIITVNDHSVTMAGNDGMINLAKWKSNGYTYAAMSDKAMSIEAMTALVSQVS